MKQIKEDLVNILTELYSNSYNIQIRKLKPNTELHSRSIFSYIPNENKINLLNYIDNTSNIQVKRCLGSLIGLTIADSLGHNFEFLPVQDFIGKNGSYLEYPSSVPGGKIHQPLNQFRLKPGQWTDDSSMALCQADSLLVCGGFNGSHMRCYFWNWWNNNVNNAFRYDESRNNSCGLGGNISQSLGDVSNRSELPNFVIPHKYGSFNEDSGNGSLMRLAPIPIRYHSNIKKAREYAYLSSLTTHPGTIAAEACSFVSYLIIKCIHRKSPNLKGSSPPHSQSKLKSSFLTSFLPSPSSPSSPKSPTQSTSISSSSTSGSNSGEFSEQTIQEFLDKIIEEYIILRDSENNNDEEESIGWKTLKNVLIGRNNPPTERCWDWRSDTLDFESTLAARGKRYNGYPVSATYFGAYSLDGLSMALHSLYHNTSFNMTIVKVINMCGDADSTGAICAQIAGAYYGIDEIDPIWLRDLRRWDPDREIELRALLLYSAGIICDLPDRTLPNSSQISTSTSTTSITPAINENIVEDSNNNDTENQKVSIETNDMQIQDDIDSSDLNCTELHLSSFFPEPDTKPVIGFRHSEYQEPPQPSRSFDNPYTANSKRKFSIFRLFS